MKAHKVTMSNPATPVCHSEFANDSTSHVAVDSDLAPVVFVEVGSLPVHPPILTLDTPSSKTRRRRKTYEPKRSISCSCFKERRSYCLFSGCSLLLLITLAVVGTAYYKLAFVNGTAQDTPFFRYTWNMEISGQPGSESDLYDIRVQMAHNDVSNLEACQIRCQNHDTLVFYEAFQGFPSTTKSCLCLESPDKRYASFCWTPENYEKGFVQSKYPLPKTLCD